MTKILIATDGSAVACAAVDTGIELASVERAEVVFVRVGSLLDLELDRRAGPAPPTRMPRVEDDDVLNAALARARECGVDATAELLIGYPSKQIARLAHEIGADLVVVGSRPRGAVKRAVLGSTSRELVSHGDRPVLVVKAESGCAAGVDAAAAGAAGS